MSGLINRAESAVEAGVPAARGARLAVYAMLVLLAIGVVAFAGWWIFLRPVTAATQAAQAKVDSTLNKATGDIATKAIPVINEAGRQKVEVEVKVQKGIADVRAAPDAGVEVRGVSDALRRNLCLYHDYAADPACQPVHEDPAGVGAARPDGPGAAVPD